MPEHIVKLTKPLTTHKGKVNQIVLREASARDYIMMRKVPFTITTSIDVDPTNKDPEQKQRRTVAAETDYDIAFDWAARLSGIEKDILATLAGPNVTRLINALREAIGELDEDQTDPNKNEERAKNESASSPT